MQKGTRRHDRIQIAHSSGVGNTFIRVILAHLPQSIRLPCPAQACACPDDWHCYHRVWVTSVQTCTKVEVVG